MTPHRGRGARDVQIATSTPPRGGRSAHQAGNTALASSRATALIGTTLLVIGVALAAANLRPAVTSLASVLEQVRGSVGASHAWASALTALPALCFGAAGVLAPRLNRHFGLARAVGGALVLLTTGLALRVVDGAVVVLSGTLLACAGIALGNVLIPVVIKQSYPDRLGVVTGVYMGALAGGGALGAALTPSMADATGSWRLALGAWALLAAAAVVLWVAGARHADVVAAQPPPPRRSLLRNRLAWTVTVFFGLQALVAYVIMGWLPEVLIESGVDRTTAGLYLAICTLFGVPTGLFLPPLAVRMRSQSLLIAVLTLIGGLGIVGLLIAPGAAPLAWTVLAGFGMGVFPLVITVIALRTDHPADTASLSAMAQSLGYLLAACGPFLFGLLRGITGGWTASLVLVLAVTVIQAAVGYAAGRPRTV
ncbi:MFS transporter [Actinokineospora globicatena]|uniref:MFS transporter n=1 Tax=Actinokineospora globicatena TaxID=103729 RepID=UPI0020A4911C|nr:MFS transporter [Actinokineospora globicatena]MCP2305626.1 MFS transporter, CP family, cyanate transporter [Actinokineospora globicatena]GLW81496.1 MFS transporter [Actinokineospora globicatena]GLW87806.1 MFS transporter [Actinokineospora globicatena]